MENRAHAGLECRRQALLGGLGGQDLLGRGHRGEVSSDVHRVAKHVAFLYQHRTVVQPDVDRHRVVARPAGGDLRLHVTRREHAEIGTGEDAHHFVPDRFHQPSIKTRERAGDQRQAGIDDVTGGSVAEFLVQVGALADVSEHHRHGSGLSRHNRTDYNAGTSVTSDRIKRRPPSRRDPQALKISRQESRAWKDCRQRTSPPGRCSACPVCRWESPCARPASTGRVRVAG